MKTPRLRSLPTFGRHLVRTLPVAAVLLLFTANASAPPASPASTGATPRGRNASTAT
jgi:hypothetical protein